MSTTFPVSSSIDAASASVDAPDGGVRGVAAVPDEAAISALLRTGRAFEDMPNRGSVDYVLRTVQQGLVHFSTMADAKANILITVCALLFSVGLTQMDEIALRVPMLVLLSAAAASLVLAILGIVPWTARGAPRRGDGSPGPYNPLFFMHVAEVEPGEYVERMDRLFSDPPALTEAIVRDIHGQSRALATKKFRLLRWSYAVLLTGVVGSALLLIAQHLLA